MVGKSISHYEITDKIGEGGMGVVYRARDTKLGRDVALKVLPEQFARDPQRMGRFEREARVLASLNHPHIASIYGLEESNGVRALVMELVEGPTLADRIDQGAIPLDEALTLVRQIADALEYAHEHGVIHRDLKPANVKVNEEGTVKVLDFGLAKAMTDESSVSDPENSPTLTIGATKAGVILGTAAYMAPEQARGKRVDKRADIWSFGVVLYEMVTGQRLFRGEDLTDTLASVVRDQPDLSAAPAKVRRLLSRCLEKEPKKRLRDIGDAWELLDHEPRARATATHSRLPWAVAAVAAVVAVALALVHFSEPASEPPVVIRSSYAPPVSRRLNLTYPAIAIAPDGRSFAFASTGSRGLQLRAMDSLEATPVPGTTEQNVTTPFFSPDGMSVGYFQNGQLKRIAVNGGGPRVIAPATRSFGASWVADGTILFSQPQGILRVSAEGGTPELVIPAEEGERFDYPQLLPGGRTVLLSRTTGTWDEADVVAVSLATGARQVLVPGGSAARYLPTGHLAYTLDARLFAVAFDPDSLAVSGEGVPLVDGVRQGLDGTAANYGVSDSGTLVYVTFPSIDRGLVWVGRNGQEQPLSTPFRDYENLSLSPDGRRAALEVSENGVSEVWVTELERGTLTRLNAEGGFSAFPIWSPDGRRVVFSTRQNGRWELRSRTADGTGDAVLLARFDETVQEVRSSSWLPDGTTVVFDILTPDTGYDIAFLSVDEPGKWQPLIQTAAPEAKPAVSPDGRWIAYQSTEGGETQIYLQRLPGLGDRRQVTVGSAIHFNATWSRDGNSLFYVRVGATFDMLRSSFGEDAAGAPVIGPSVLQLSYRFFSAPWTFRTWGLSPDEDRFLMIGLGQGVAPDSAESRPQIIIVQNWFEELKRQVPGAN